MNLFEKLMETSSQAIFTVDRNGILTHINQRAKERFGLFMHSSYSHPAGKLNRGDLILLASTEIGADDGNLTREDLERIGIHDRRIRIGGKIAAIGVYEDVTVKPVYKYLKPGTDDGLEIETIYQGVPIRICIDTNQITVSVWGMQYSISYFRSIGQIVVVDRLRHRVKFWEENGYSARKEGVGNLLRGAPYAAKAPEAEMKVVGYHFRDFFEGERFEEDLRQVLARQVSQYVNQEYEINGFALVASLLPVISGDEVTDVIVRFRNIDEFKDTIIERNDAIRLTEKTYREAKHLSDQSNALFSLPGSTLSMVDVKRYANKLAQMGCHILITGEVGTGKTALARAVASTGATGGKYTMIDCSVEEDLEVQMLGSAERPGALRQTDGSTVFLDDIDSLSPLWQSRILSVLQNGRLTLPDTGEIIPVKVRIIAATSKDLKELVEQGRFRSDLYYRLHAFSLELPPLRKCKEDIPFIVNSLMDELRQKYGLQEKYLSGEAFDKLIAYDWPGNIRELENVLERAVVLSDTEMIYTEHIRLDTVSPVLPLREQLKQVERQLIQQTLVQCGGDRKIAMQKLGLSRSVFYDKLREYHLN